MEKIACHGRREQRLEIQQVKIGLVGDGLRRFGRIFQGAGDMRWQVGNGNGVRWVIGACEFLILDIFGLGLFGHGLEEGMDSF